MQPILMIFLLSVCIHATEDINPDGTLSLELSHQKEIEECSSHDFVFRDEAVFGCNTHEADEDGTASGEETKTDVDPSSFLIEIGHFEGGNKPVANDDLGKGDRLIARLSQSDDDDDEGDEMVRLSQSGDDGDEMMRLNQSDVEEGDQMLPEDIPRRRAQFDMSKDNLSYVMKYKIMHKSTNVDYTRDIAMDILEDNFSDDWHFFYVVYDDVYGNDEHYHRWSYRSSSYMVVNYEFRRYGKNMMVVATNKSRAGCPDMDNEISYYSTNWKDAAFRGVWFNQHDAKGITNYAFDGIKSYAEDIFVGSIRYGNGARMRYKCRTKKCRWMNTNGSSKNWSSVFSVVNC